MVQKNTYDVIVCGGGPAGIAASIVAARLGARVLLLERYGRLGGMAVSGLVQPIMGSVESSFVSSLISRLGGRQVDFERFDILAAREILNSGADILLHCMVTGARLQNQQVVGVCCATKAGPMEFRGKVFVDATGDGDLAFLAGAEFEQGRPADGLMQPASIMFRVSGVDEDRALQCGSEEQAMALRVDGKTWHEIVLEAQKAGVLPETIGVVRTYATHRCGERVVNATQVNGIDGTDVHDLTKAELEGRKQAYQVLDFLRQYAPGYKDAYISAMPAVVGIRETRRFRGVAYLERSDLVEGRRRVDAVVKGACFPIDIHNPAGAGQAEGFAAPTKPYDIPLGCLVPKRIDGLLLSGRCISGSHEAHASYRVMAIAMATGAAAGAAAGLSQQEGVQPRALGVEKVQKALAEQEHQT